MKKTLLISLAFALSVGMKSQICTFDCDYRSNTFGGSQAGLYQGPNVYYNTYFGNSAGRSNAQGSKNTFIGSSSGYSNNGGEKNTFVGYQSGYLQASGSENTFFGSESGYNNGGSYNSFIGSHSGYMNTSGENNIFIGRYAGNGNSTGSKNVFLGNQTGNFNGNGIENSFVGYMSGYYSNGSDYNAFFGTYSGYNITNGRYNTSIGNKAGYSSSTGQNNVYLGYTTGYRNTVGSENTMLGSWAGYYNTTGSGNIFIGYKAGLLESGSDKLYIANSETSSPLLYGDFNAGYVQINGDLIITGTVSQSGLKSGTELQTKLLSINAEGKVQVIETNVDELVQENKNLRNEIETMKSELNSLKRMLQSLNNEQLGNFSAAVLLDCKPNPTNAISVISYFVPSGTSVATISLYNSQGTKVLEQDIQQTGMGSITLELNELPKGMYVYVLTVDGTNADSKKVMIVERN